MARTRYADPNKPETKELADRIVRERGSVLRLCAMPLRSGPRFIEALGIDSKDDLSTTEASGRVRP